MDIFKRDRSTQLVVTQTDETGKVQGTSGVAQIKGGAGVDGLELEVVGIQELENTVKGLRGDGVVVVRLRDLKVGDALGLLLFLGHLFVVELE